jgi:hypothetical protein
MNSETKVEVPHHENKSWDWGPTPAVKNLLDLAPWVNKRMEHHKSRCKIDFSIEIQTRFTSKTQRSPPFLPHLIIGTRKFGSWLRNANENREVEMSPLPLGSYL